MTFIHTVLTSECLWSDSVVQNTWQYLYWIVCESLWLIWEQDGMTTLTKRNRRADAPAEQNDVRRESDEEEDTDSKSLRLTLMEEILLLGIKDKEVFTLVWSGLVWSDWSGAGEVLCRCCYRSSSCTYTTILLNRSNMRSECQCEPMRSSCSVRHTVNWRLRDGLMVILMDHHWDGIWGCKLSRCVHTQLYIKPFWSQISV